MTVPFLDLKRQYKVIRNEIDGAISRVLSRGQFILGEEVEAFENEFAAYCGVKYAVGVGSGTDALHLSLMACGVGEGDEVVTVSHTSGATVAAIEMTGARPAFGDIEFFRYTMSPLQLRLAISIHSAAIIPVHLYGCPADTSLIEGIAYRANKAWIIEDCSQAHGATYKGKKVGTFGDLGCFSFYPTKNLGAYGDGGAVITDDKYLAERLRELRQYGWKERYVSATKGICSRLDEIQAAILRVKLRHLDVWNARRRGLAELYTLRLGDTVGCPYCPGDSAHAYHNYVVRTPHRDDLRAFLQERGIGTAIHYPVPVHLQPAYRHLEYKKGSLPITEMAAQEVLSLPMFPELTVDEVNEVCEAIIEWGKTKNEGLSLYP